MNDLITKILEVTGVSFNQICSISKKREIVNSRALFCHIMRFKLGYTCEQLEPLVNRHHSTISRLSSSKKIDKLLNKINYEEKETNSKSN